MFFVGRTVKVFGTNLKGCYGYCKIQSVERGANDGGLAC